MKAQPPFVEGQRLFKDIQAPLDQEEGSPPMRPAPDETFDSDARTARNLVIWTFSAFAAFWVMVFAAYMFIR